MLIVGMDEVGRGPLAGPVVAAAVILNPNKNIEGLKDSKQLSAKQRAKLNIQIREHAIAYAIELATVAEIDQMNILNASLLAMKRAYEQLKINEPHFVRVDGKYKPAINIEVIPVIKGDQLHQEISAASIIAKVYRDQLMEKYDLIYPQYGFASHKGYGTSMHIDALEKYGPCDIHRKSFMPKKLKKYYESIE